MTMIPVTRTGIALEDGRTFGPYRIGIQEQLKWADHAAARGHRPDDPVRGVIFMTWYAAHRRGELSQSYAEFLASDANVGEWVDEPAPSDRAEAEESEEILTLNGTNYGSPAPASSEDLNTGGVARDDFADPTSPAMSAASSSDSPSEAASPYQLG